MKTKAMWLSSERARGFLASQFYSVECGSRARWVATWAP